MKIFKLFIAILIIFSMTGCVLFLGQTAVIGIGKKNIEYYESGKLKKLELEGNSPAEGIISIGKY